MRVRITFSKTDAMRYTANMDLFRAWERTMRRAGLPLEYSQGFNPRPHMQLASALPLGFTSQCEMLDAWLQDGGDSAEQIREKLIAASPPGIQIDTVTEVDSGSPALQNRVHSAEYVVTLLESCPDASTRVATLLDSETLPRQRRGKSYDLRPLIHSVALLPSDECGHIRLQMILAAGESRTGRPDEVLAALGVPPESTRVHRTRLIINQY
jgi:radical SAM-linked protein